MALRASFKMNYIFLKDLKPGIEAIISDVLIGGDLGWHLAEMGVQPGFEILKIRRFWFDTSIVEIGSANYAMGKYLSKRIIVRYE